MKKFLFLLIGLLITASAFAQWKTSAGPVFYYSPYILYESYKDSAAGMDYDYSATLNMLEAGAVLDVTYLQIGASLAFFLGGTNSMEGTFDFTPVDISGEDLKDSKLTSFNISLIGKYPIDLGNAVLWPAIGFQYSIRLVYELNGVDYTETADALDDFYILAGLGIDFPVAENATLSPAAILAYNLTPDLDSDLPNGVRQTNFVVKIGLQLRFAI